MVNKSKMSLEKFNNAIDKFNSLNNTNIAQHMCLENGQYIWPQNLNPWLRNFLVDMGFKIIVNGEIMYVCFKDGMSKFSM